MTEATGSTTLITGATGLIGTALADSLLANGGRVLRAVRRDVRDAEGEIHWNPSQGEIDAEKLEGVDAVVHLAGANIAGRRWSESYKRELRESRTVGTKLVSETIASLQQKPRVLACASAIGFYGDRGAESLDESAAGGDGRRSASRAAASSGRGPWISISGGSRGSARGSRSRRGTSSPTAPSCGATGRSSSAGRSGRR